jgi:hypothetical protein
MFHKKSVFYLLPPAGDWHRVAFVKLVSGFRSCLRVIYRQMPRGVKRFFGQICIVAAAILAAVEPGFPARRKNVSQAESHSKTRKPQKTLRFFRAARMPPSTSGRDARRHNNAGVEMHPSALQTFLSSLCARRQIDFAKHYHVRTDSNP